MAPLRALVREGCGALSVIHREYLAGDGAHGDGVGAGVEVRDGEYATLVGLRRTGILRAIVDNSDRRAQYQRARGVRYRARYGGGDLRTRVRHCHHQET